MIKDKLKIIKESRLSPMEHLLVKLFDGIKVDSVISTKEYTYWKIGKDTSFKYIYDTGELRCSALIRKFIIKEINFIDDDDAIIKEVIGNMFKIYVFENRYNISKVRFFTFAS